MNKIAGLPIANTLREPKIVLVDTPVAMPRIFMAVRSPDTRVESALVAGLVDTVLWASQQGVPMLCSLPTSPISDNETVARFLKTDCTVLLFINSNVAFTAQDVVGICTDGEDIEKAPGVLRLRRRVIERRLADHPDLLVPDASGDVVTNLFPNDDLSAVDTW